MHRVYPSFILKGTTLTQTALIFITFIYESSNLTWRAIPDKFCDDSNKIAHSTLFKAVHGFGKSLCANNKIREAVTEFFTCHLSGAEAWPVEKSRYEHTLEREHSVREILLSLFSYETSTFTGFFFKYLRPLRMILSGLSPPVSRLYYPMRNMP